MAAVLVDHFPVGPQWRSSTGIARWPGNKAPVCNSYSSHARATISLAHIHCKAAVTSLPVDSAILDGEIVAFDEQGRPSFQRLQHRAAKGIVMRYFAFDLLHLAGRDLMREPLDARRAALRKVVAGSDVEFFELSGTPEHIVQAVAHVGLEGVVAKRRDSRYEAGKRSEAWQKFKIKRRQEFVIGGSNQPTGTSTRWSSAITKGSGCGCGSGQSGIYAGSTRGALRSPQTPPGHGVPVCGSSNWQDWTLGRGSDRRGHEDAAVGQA